MTPKAYAAANPHKRQTQPPAVIYKGPGSPRKVARREWPATLTTLTDVFTRRWNGARYAIYYNHDDLVGRHEYMCNVRGMSSICIWFHDSMDEEAAFAGAARQIAIKYNAGFDDQRDVSSDEEEEEEEEDQPAAAAAAAPMVVDLSDLPESEEVVLVVPAQPKPVVDLTFLDDDEEEEEPQEAPQLVSHVTATGTQVVTDEEALAAEVPEAAAAPAAEAAAEVDAHNNAADAETQEWQDELAMGNEMWEAVQAHQEQQRLELLANTQDFYASVL